MSILMTSLKLAGIFVVAASLSGCGAIRQQQQQQAMEEHQAAIKKVFQERDAEVKAALKECRDKRISGELKTYVEAAKCSSPKIFDAYQKENYPYMDLVNLYVAKRVEIAGKLDKKKLTESEADLKIAEVTTELTNEQRRRNLENMSANNQATVARAAQTHANVAAAHEDRQKWDSLIEQGNRMMNPPPHPAVPASRPTNCVVNEPFNAPWAKTTINCQ